MKLYSVKVLKISLDCLIQEKTGMVLVEVELVTGWEAVSPERLINEVDSGVQRVESDKEENKVNNP